MRTEWFKDRVAIVTGASSGIGRQVAIDLARAGATVVGVARRADLLEEVAAACRAHTPASEAIVADVGERDSIEAACRAVLERHGRVDVLVNNAAIPMRVHASRLTPDEIEQTMRVNYLGAIWATYAVLPSMLERSEGHVVNVGSVAARMGSPREGAYTASKFALAGFSEVLAADLDRSGVRVHVVVPGPIDTEIWSKVAEPPAYRGKLYPPAIVSRALQRAILRNRFEVWAPRRLRFVSLVHAVARQRYVKGIAAYDRRHTR